jgi:hypothetical protein
MAPHDWSAILGSMRRSVMEGTYIVTPHAMLELREDHLDVIDLESAILTGRINRVFDDDPRGRRYEVIGTAADLTTPVAVVARFLAPRDRVLIITVFEIRR